jgi:hypothetical protein
MMIASPACQRHFRWSGAEFTILDILPVGESQSLSDNTLGSSQVIRSSPLSLPGSDTKRSNTVRITESDESETSEHGDTSVGSSAACHGSLHGGEDILLVDSTISINIGDKKADSPELSGLLEIVGKDVEHELRVRVCVDVPVGLGIKLLPERRGVDEVSVLHIS